MVAADGAALVFLFVVRSVARKLITIALIGVAVFGLARYHQTLQSCDDKGCACKLFGESVLAMTGRSLHG